MDLSEYPLINTPNLMLTLLKSAAVRPIGIDDAVAAVADLLARAREDASSVLPEIRRRLRRCIAYLVEAKALEMLPGPLYRASERGIALVREHPLGVDESVLMRFPEYQAFIARAARSTSPDGLRPHRHPSRDYDAGYAAFQEGRSLADNPHDVDSRQHLSWENGWFEALDEAREHAGGG